MPRKRWPSAIVVALLVLALPGCSVTGCGTGKTDSQAIDANGGSISALGGAVGLTVPPNAVTGKTKVDFVPAKELPDEAFQTISMANAAQLTMPVDIHTEGGATLPGGRIKVSFKLPADVPTDKYPSIFVYVYDDHLGQAFPLVDSVADPKTHTVAATAPHFSLFGAATRLVRNVGHGLIKASLYGQMAVFPFMALPPVRDFIEELETKTFDKLLNIGPDLNCDPKSTKVRVTVKGSLKPQFFEGCAEPVKDKDGVTRLRLKNYLPYPMLAWTHSGVTVGMDDLPEDTDLFEFLRYWIWSGTDKVAIPMGNIGVGKLMPSAPLPMEFNAYIDQGGILVDSVWVAITTLIGPLKIATTELRAFLTELTKVAPELVGVVEGLDKAIDGFKAAHPEANEQTLDQLKLTTDILGCVTGDLRKPSTEGAKAPTEAERESMADRFRTCFTTETVKKLLEKIVKQAAGDLAGTIAGLTSDIKVIPMALGTQADRVLTTLSLGHADLDVITIRVEALGPGGQPLPAPSSDLSGTGQQYGYVTNIDPGSRKVQIDLVEYITGTREHIQQACREDGIPESKWVGEECNDYHIRNDNPKLRELTVAPNATVTKWDQRPNSDYGNVPSTLQELSQRYTQGRTFYRFTVENNVITNIGEEFKP
ncbi:hypothetical protein ACFPIJ_12165 [Dactylosporangium cerinum]|uniref:Lipoprotein n=1 Tax=Dactylosporangium cerinum TaxID=1434730 RepID=A0ABV9VQM2_9ACTN